MLEMDSARTSRGGWKAGLGKICNHPTSHSGFSGIADGTSGDCKQLAGICRETG